MIRKKQEIATEFSWKPFWGLGCATTDRVVFLVRYIHGAAADRTGSFGEPRGGPATLLNAFRAKSRLSVFSWKMGEISWKMDSDQKSVSTDFLLWTQRSQK